tara:strand:- start:158 stop:721 length:564 start_codon:yes stop_codon:yes gene_type:complete
MNKYLIVGLGNVGLNYTNTRHNIGFEVLDYLAVENAFVFSDKKYGELAKLKVKGKLIYFLKPSTFMNLSGKAIHYYLNHLKISLENLLIISDDLNLDFGNIRLRKKGSHGGHNGHKNIIETLKTSSYCRLRFGIGKNFHKGEQVKYVLSKWSKEEQTMLKEKLDLCSKIILYFVLSGIDQTMCNFNN